MISLLITSRIESNPNWGLPNLLQSLVDYSADHNNFEVLVKFDTCDPEVPAYLPKLGQYPFAVKHIVEPRGRGYIDIHIGYTRAMMLADDRSTVMGAFADDFVVIQPNWDTTVLAETTHFKDDIYMIHQRPHPCFYRPHFQEQPFYPHFNLDHIDELAIVDEGPFWSRKLLEICGGLGHVSFTDVWTLAIQWYLYQNHGLNRTRFLDQPQVYRVLHDEVDTREADRWDTDRRTNFDFIASDFYRTMVQNQARNVALNIQAAGGLQAQPCVKPTAVEMEQILTATARGALETGNLEDSIREFGELNRRFPNNLIAKKHLADLVGKPTEAQSDIPQIPTPPEAPKSIKKNNFSSTLEAALHL
ncbi:MAG: hypothetical protein HOL43_01110 [Verrucomicrobiales bacterium]|nr:hypothetical protein [Verrucomicrobiales bacterium]